MTIKADRQRSLKASLAKAGEPVLFDGARLSRVEIINRQAGTPLRGGNAPMPSGGLFDQDTRQQLDLLG